MKDCCKSQIVAFAQEILNHIDEFRRSDYIKLHENILVDLKEIIRERKEKR